ncbi:UvrD-helicase domain-containing protein [Halopseudomonas pachastrellae]|nr:UvrD-helicase domain-containing protein [Halopseudomonas pachastrellae]
MQVLVKPTLQSTLADWVKHGHVKADRILAVTFTTDAANQMRERIRLSLLKEGLMKEARLLQKSTISTIHAFGLEILRTFAFEAGNSPAPRQLTEPEQNILLREALDQVSAIHPLLDDLQRFDYCGGFKGDEYQEGVDQLTDTILSLIGKFRSRERCWLNVGRSQGVAGSGAGGCHRYLWSGAKKRCIDNRRPMAGD